ncbi:MAG: triacylglycerol lipase [Myxococcales bacterium]|nr:MAG: triacylglycerol lipase [Myxococcales bacterium]
MSVVCGSQSGSAFAAPTELGKIRAPAMPAQRHIFLIPGFFGFANLGDFAYWGPVQTKLAELLDEARMPATLHPVRSLPTASLRARTRCLLETIVATCPEPDAIIHLIGHSTGGLDARLLLTPAVDLGTEIDIEAYAARVRASVSVSTPHHGAPIASLFASVLGRQLLRLLSVLTMATLRVGELPLSVWAEVATLFALPTSLRGATGTLAAQLYRQLLADFNEERREQVRELLAAVERDQSLLTQLTVETMDLFNAAAGNRAGVLYGSVVTRARAPGLATVYEIGVDPVDQAQHAIYYSLSRLATGHDFPPLDGEQARVLAEAFGEAFDDDPGDDASDGIVPTVSQPWGRVVAAARADHLDIIGHYAGDARDGPDERHYDWLTTRSHFRAPQFRDVWQRIVSFLAEAEAA